MVDIISTIALILSLGGQLLLSKKSKLMFPLWIISNICWIIVNIISSFNFQQVIMYIIYTIINIYSWYSWIKNDKENIKQDNIKVI